MRACVRACIASPVARRGAARPAQRRWQSPQVDVGGEGRQRASGTQAALWCGLRGADSPC
eukprot:scaffold3283_cov430-Prasinococcus_capsulatus_cf.AAC.1